MGLGEQKRGGHPVGFTPVYAAYVIRLLPEGGRDATFGTGGDVQTAFGLPRLYAQAAIASAVALDGDGRIYTAAVVYGKKPNAADKVQVARFLPGN